MIRVFQVDPTEPERVRQGVEAAAQALLAGDLVVLPTETVYGIAARPDDEEATARLFAAKRRPEDLTLPILVPSAEKGWRLAVENEAARRLAAEFWPGPLTLVLPRTERSLGWELGMDRRTLAVRVPDHPLTAALLRLVGPLAATSANLSGEGPLDDPTDLVAAFGERVAVYLVLSEGAPHPRGMASTVVDLTSESPSILRPGPVDSASLSRALGGSPIGPTR
jgi:L-threonylcarbamoyladenylate synthase